MTFVDKKSKKELKQLQAKFDMKNQELAKLMLEAELNVSIYLQIEQKCALHWKFKAGR